MQRIPADLCRSVTIGRNLAAELARQHLRAKAYTEIGSVFLEWHFQPVDLRLDEFVWVIGAHRAAENHRTGMVFKGARQGIAKDGATDIEIITFLDEKLADTTGAGALLMKNDENRAPVASHASVSQRHPAPPVRP